MMKQVTLQHFLNDKAYSVMSEKSFSEINCEPSDSLKEWLGGISIVNGYLISKIENAEQQIQNCKEYMKDEFWIEMHLNKIHLQDDYMERLPNEKYIGLYIYICNFFQKLIISGNSEISVVLWYSTDAYNEEEEFPSHTVSFAMERKESSAYPLNSDNYHNVFHIGKRISIS